MPLPPAPSRRARALVADDQPDMRALMAATLRRLGLDVVEVGSGPELLQALVDGLTGPSGPLPPDLIVTDVRMPGCSGLEVLARLRRNDWHTPVILVTAFCDPETARRAQQLGAACLLDKPFALEELTLAARAALGRR